MQSMSSARILVSRCSDRSAHEGPNWWSKLWKLGSPRCPTPNSKLGNPPPRRCPPPAWRKELQLERKSNKLESEGWCRKENRKKCDGKKTKKGWCGKRKEKASQEAQNRIALDLIPSTIKPCNGIEYRASRTSECFKSMHFKDFISSTDFLRDTYIIFIVFILRFHPYIRSYLPWGLKMGRVDFDTARHTYDPNDKTLAWVFISPLIKGCKAAKF